MVALCQHHHNMKTDGRAFYILDPDTGDVVWLFEDGTWLITEAEGPLAPKVKRWAQTVGQLITANRTKAHERAQALKEEIEQGASNPSATGGVDGGDGGKECDEDIPF